MDSCITTLVLLASPTLQRNLSVTQYLRHFAVIGHGLHSHPLEQLAIRFWDATEEHHMT